jgi:Holliday junction DNA helicase RuvA
MYIECSGVGYLVNISLATYSVLENEKQTKIYTYLLVREDAHILYGFATEEEKEMFLHLLSVSGVGGNTARLILSSISIQELKNAILTENEVVIRAIKGIGPKSAKRLILELKDKVVKLGSGTEGVQGPISSGQFSEEALAALVMLGFAKNTAEKALQKIMAQQSPVSVEDLIKKCLQIL